MKDTVSLLRRCSLFKGSTSEQIESLLGKTGCRVGSFEENEVIFSPLHSADKIGIILSGTVDVQKSFPTGKILLVQRKGATELIGESSIFSKLSYYPDTVIASKPSEILFISKGDLLTLFSQDRDFMSNFLESTSNYTLILTHKIGILSLTSIQAKIAGFLIHYRNHRSDGADECASITIPFSKKDWAEYMNVSRTSLSRELRKLEEEGVLSFEKRTIKVMNWPRLEEILSN